MGWDVRIVGKAKKQADKLPIEIYERLFALIAQLTLKGAVLPERSHFGQIKGTKNEFHCHLKDVHPTYVACWRLIGVLCWHT
jgi:mRNA-degrading endonuclease RelE of RelBE toxin-antitoxin system